MTDAGPTPDGTGSAPDPDTVEALATALAAWPVLHAVEQLGTGRASVYVGVQVDLRAGDYVPIDAVAVLLATEGLDVNVVGIRPMDEPAGLELVVRVRAPMAPASIEGKPE